MSEHFADAQIRRNQPGESDAEEAKSDAEPTVRVATDKRAGANAANAPAPNLLFFPASQPFDLAPLDPAQNGVLDALKRIERNTAGRAVGVPKRATAVAAPTREAANASSVAMPVSTARLAASQNTATNTDQLRQQVYRVKRIERQAERTLPPIRQPRTTGHREPMNAEPLATVARSTATRNRPPSPEKPSAEATADVKPTDKPLTADELRKMPLRGDGGRFLSRDEKAGMSKAELAQAKAREERQQAKQEDKTDTLLSKLGEIAHETLTEQGDATDGVGTAVGNAYYSAAKEVYSGYQELAGEDSKARELYQWARGHWEKRRNASEETQSKAAAADREQGKQAEARHDDISDELQAIAATNEDGFEEVVKEVKRIQGGGGTSILPTRAGLGRATPGGAGGRGGAAGGGTAPRGRMGRLWDRVRSPFTPSSASAAATPTASNATSGAARAAQAASSASSGASGTARALTGISRTLGALAAPVTGALAYNATQNELAERDDLTQAQRTTTAVSTGVGAGGGALAGAAAGAGVGAAAGSVVPIVGTGIGGLLGGIIGGALGAWGGEKAGRTVGDAVASTMDNVEEEARKALDEREERLKRQEALERKWYNPTTWFSGGGSPAPQSTQAPRSFGGMPGAGARSAQASTDASLVERDDFGRVAEKYESSGVGVSTVSTGINDPGGVSYGKHQLSSEAGTMQVFLDSQEGAAYRDQFAGMRPGSDEFSARYREIAAQDGEAFGDAQQAFIKRTHYDPVANYAATQGMDTDSEAIQEALYSQSVQHSGEGNRKIIDDAMSRVGPDATESEVIDALYDARGDYASDFVQPSAGRERYAREREDVRAISQARAAESQTGEPGSTSENNRPPPSIAAPTSPASPAAAEADARPMTVAAAMDYAINGTPAVEPVLPSEPVTPIDDRQAAKAFSPRQPQPSGALRRERRERAPVPAPAAAPSLASNAQPVSANSPRSPRGGESAPGVNDIQINFSDSVLTLMAMDRI